MPRLQIQLWNVMFLGCLLYRISLWDISQKGMVVAAKIIGFSVDELMVEPNLITRNEKISVT